MADTVFNDGNSTGVWSDAANWSAGKPAAGESWQISADCSCDSDESAAELGAGTIDASITLTLTGSGKVYVSDADVTIAAGATLAMDGGTFRLTETDGVVHSLNVRGTITGTTNCGTNDIELSTATSVKARLYFDVAAASIAGISTTNRIHIVEVGATQGDFYIAINDVSVTNVKIEGLRRIVVSSGTASLTACVLDSMLFALDVIRCLVTLDRCTFSNNTAGVYVEYASYFGYVRAKDCTFSGNTKDIKVDAGTLVWHASGCTRPTTDVAGGATLTVVPSRPPRAMVGV